jgi:glycerate 2-kinase
LPDRNQLRRNAREIFDHALSSVDPRRAIKRAVTIDGPVVDIDGVRVDVSARNVYAIALGKAAASMARGLDETLGSKLKAGLLTALNAPHEQRWKGFAGGHPLPNEASLDAARAAFALLERANLEQAIVFFLVSGGGSAMLEWPSGDDITLADLQLANHVLVNCGARIAEINSVRRAFSAVKGGALARRAGRAEIFTLIVSDTNRGDEASVASGPTFAPATDEPQALDVVEQYGLETRLPESIMNAVRVQQPAHAAVNGFHAVLLDNGTAVAAARDKAQQLGFAVETAEEICEQPIERGCDLLLARLFAMETSAASCLISGGEFSCPVRGDGRGGRNLETALRCAIALDKTTTGQRVTILSAGTDGVDGNSPAAGAIADETTVARARKVGLDPNEFLAHSDSYSFFAQTNDLIVTGPTLTNVRDLRICLRSS